MILHRKLAHPYLDHWRLYIATEGRIRDFIHTQDSGLYLCLGFDHYRLDPRLMTMILLLVYK